MSLHLQRLSRRVIVVLATVFIMQVALPLTVEKISLERMTRESGAIVHGRVLSYTSQWEGSNIFTYTKVRVAESLKGDVPTVVTIKQLGGEVGDMASEIPGTPKLRIGEDVVLFLTPWQGHYWIHSIVLGKFTVSSENGREVAVNDLHNIGLIDPMTKKEITDASQRESRFALSEFLTRVRVLAAQERGAE